MGDSRTEQYPRDLLQFERQFGTEEACRDYLATLRWPEGFRCRRCGSTRAWSRKARALMDARQLHWVASLLKRWLLGTHQGSVRPPHLDYYLDEFTFRFNRRSSRSRGKLFYRLVQQAAEVAPVSWRNIAEGENHNG